MVQVNSSDAPGGASLQPSIDWQAELARHERWLRTIVAARLREADATADVMQEISLAAVKQAAPISDITKTGPWLYRLAIRQCLLYRRKAGRRRKLTERYTEKFQPDEQDRRVPDPLSWLLADERRQMVRAALARMSGRDAEILLLKYTENWSYHEIAAHLGLSHSAVEARLHRARARMRNELAALDVISAVD